MTRWCHHCGERKEKRTSPGSGIPSYECPNGPHEAGEVYRGP